MRDGGSTSCAGDGRGQDGDPHRDVHELAGYLNLCAGCYTYDAFLCHSGHMTDIGTLGGSGSQAHGINDFGEVVGQASTPTSRDAFLYTGGKMTDLGALGAYCSAALRIKNPHEVVGYHRCRTAATPTRS